MRPQIAYVSKVDITACNPTIKIGDVHGLTELNITSSIIFISELTKPQKVLPQCFP